MGTNYYLHKKPCKCCKKSDDTYHIGKSSGGWVFSLHVDKWEGINSLCDLLPLINDPENTILNEYGEEIKPEEMIKTITERSWREREYPYKDWTGKIYNTPEEHAKSTGAIVGPNGLWRHELGRYCIGHGEGTWDYITGEFS